MLGMEFRGQLRTRPGVTLKKSPNGGWIVLGVLFVCSMFIVHAFIKYAYNRCSPFLATTKKCIRLQMKCFLKPLTIHTFNLRCINTIQQYIDGFEYNVYEIKIQEDDNYLWMFIQSLFGHQDGDELQLSSQSISEHRFRFMIIHRTALWTDSFSCSNFADCDEDGDGWLYD